MGTVFSSQLYRGESWGLGGCVCCLESPRQGGGDPEHPGLLDSKAALWQFATLPSSHQRATIMIWWQNNDPDWEPAQNTFPSPFLNDYVLPPRLDFGICEIGDMLLDCAASGVPTLRLQQPPHPPPLDPANEATGALQAVNPDWAHYHCTLSTAQSPWGVTINIFINPSSKPVSEIHLDTQPTLIFINSFFQFLHLFLVFSSLIIWWQLLVFIEGD